MNLIYAFEYGINIMKSIKIIIYMSLLTTASFSQNPHDWHYCGPLETPVNITALYLYGDSSIIAAAYRMPVLYISHNNGTTWDTLTNKLPGNQQGVKHLEMVNGVLYACYLDDNSGAGIWKSLDTGKTWEGTHYPGRDADGFTWFGDYIFASNSPVHRSADSGRTWKSFIVNEYAQVCMCLTHYKDTLFAGTYSGIFRSVDTGKTWLELIPGETTDYYTADFLGKVLIVGNQVDVSISDDFGISWESTLFGDYECFKYEDSLIFARSGIHYKISSDTGKTWQDFKQYDSAGSQMYFDRIWSNDKWFFINNGWGIFKQKKDDSTSLKNKHYNYGTKVIDVQMLPNKNIIIVAKEVINAVNLFSLNGKKIRNDIKKNSKRIFTIESNSIPAGLYIVTVDTKKYRYSKPLLIKM